MARFLCVFTFVFSLWLIVSRLVRFQKLHEYKVFYGLPE